MLTQAYRTLNAVLFGLMLGSCAKSSPRPTPQPSGYRDQVLADKPVGYWRLDETSGTIAFDQTSNRNDGAIEGGVTTGYGGAISSDTDAAMFFDGRTGDISVPTSASLEIEGGSITLEAWVRYVGPQPSEVTVIGKGTAGVQTEYGLVLVDGVPGYQSVVERYLSTSSALRPGVWAHLVVTVAPNGVGTFYVNGAVAGTFSASPGHLVTHSGQPVMIATEAGISVRFVGGIDEAAIYSYPLTAQQVASHLTAAERNSQN